VKKIIGYISIIIICLSLISILTLPDKAFAYRYLIQLKCKNGNVSYEVRECCIQRARNTALLLAERDGRIKCVIFKIDSLVQ